MQSQKRARRLAWELVIRIAKRGVSKNKRAKFERIVEKREKQLQKRLCCIGRQLQSWRGSYDVAHNTPSN